MMPQPISKNLTVMTVHPIDDTGKSDGLTMFKDVRLSSHRDLSSTVVESRTDDSSAGKSRSSAKSDKRAGVSPTKAQGRSGSGSARDSPRKRMHRRNRYIIASNVSSKVFAPSNCDKQIRRRRNHALTSNEYERIFYANGLVLASS